MLGFTRFMGTSAQRDKAEKALGELTGSSDALVAGNAHWALGLRREISRSSRSRPVTQGGGRGVRFLP
jgi:hypothetical protein